MNVEVVRDRRNLTLLVSSPRVFPPLSCSNVGFCPFGSVPSVISRALYDKRISQEVDGEALGDEFAGYVSAAAMEP